MVSYEHKRCIKASPTEEDNEPVLKEPTYPVRQIDSNKLLLPPKKPDPISIDETDVKGDWYIARKKVFKRTQLLTIEWEEEVYAIKESGLEEFVKCLSGSSWESIRTVLKAMCIKYQKEGRTHKQYEEYVTLARSLWRNYMQRR